MVVTFTMALDQTSYLGSLWGRQHGVLGDKWRRFEITTLDNGRQSSLKGHVSLPGSTETPVEFGSR